MAERIPLTARERWMQATKEGILIYIFASYKAKYGVELKRAEGIRLGRRRKAYLIGYLLSLEPEG